MGRSAPLSALSRERRIGRVLDSAARRILDVLVAALGLLLLAPLLAVIALVVRATSPGPALFRQARVGRGMVPFELLKFRTMVADAPSRGPEITVGTDSRVTPVGAVLRRTKLDELPQLVNVLKGDMSLVGPRPEVPAYVASYTDPQRRIFTVRPGITDPSSLVYRDESAVLAGYPDPERAYREVVLPHKIALSLAYVDERSVWSDVGILVRTALRLLAPALLARLHPAAGTGT
jgi:lipopolysaccharide/colanic/teichoic acid biosynthesis glycosyltransferase